MKLAKGDEVVWVSVLDGIRATTEERDAYLRFAAQQRREEGEEGSGSGDQGSGDLVLSEAQLASMAEGEQFLLTLTENGYGKRTSAYEYRVTNRGGSGITNIATSKRNGAVVASFPIEQGDQIMLMTDQGKLIRTPVEDIRICGRSTQGVTIFKIAEGEHVVSAVRINADMVVEDAAEDAEDAGEAEGDA